jgi:glycosyltransferase involved in cell wall biosynthesis
MPRVSVIIPTYNRRQYIGECLDSVLAQTYTDFEVIVVDDGSTDDTESVMERYAGKVIYKKIEHSGPSIPRNIALNMAGGDLIAFHDDDDLWQTDHLELHVKFLDDNPQIDMVFSDLELFDENGNIYDSWMSEKPIFHSIPKKSVGDNFWLLKSNIFDYLIQERFMTMPTLVVRRKCLDTAGHFDERLVAQVDYDLFLRLVKDHSVGYIDKALARCRVHGSNLSGNPQRRITSKTVMWEKIAGLYDDLPSSSRRLITDQLAHWYFELGYFFFSQNDFPSARKNLCRSLKKRLFNRRALVYYLTSYLPLGIIRVIRGSKAAASPQGRNGGLA